MWTSLLAYCPGRYHKSNHKDESMALSKEPPYEHGAISQIGVLLVNLGTPDAPTKTALKKYLKEFLSDRRVVEIPRLVWWLILNGIILNLRPKKSAEKYAAIWTNEGSPLRIHTEQQTALLQKRIENSGHKGVMVTHAMRYGSPSISETLSKLRSNGCDRILVLPLYPHYNSSTTASIVDSVFSELQTMRNIPEVRYVKHFHDHPLYIEALADRVQGYWGENGKPDKLVLSYHGVPSFSLKKGTRITASAIKLVDSWQTNLEFRESKSRPPSNRGLEKQNGYALIRLKQCKNSEKIIQDESTSFVRDLYPIASRPSRK